MESSYTKELVDNFFSRNPRYRNKETLRKDIYNLVLSMLNEIEIAIDGDYNFAKEIKMIHTTSAKQLVQVIKSKL